MIIHDSTRDADGEIMKTLVRFHESLSPKIPLP